MDRPNFLVIMTDQQRGDCLSADGHSVLMTPNMDAIGGAGVRFSRAYSKASARLKESPPAPGVKEDQR